LALAFLVSLLFLASLFGNFFSGFFGEKARKKIIPLRRKKLVPFGQKLEKS